MSSSGADANSMVARSVSAPNRWSDRPRLDEVSLGLRHRCTIEDHLALIEQGREGFVGVKMPAVASALHTNRA